MYKNLSKQRFILILCVAIFLLVILIAQFIVLAVLRAKNQELMDEYNSKQELISTLPPSTLTDEEIEDYLREHGYIYDNEQVFVGS